MTIEDKFIDQLLAAALRGDDAAWPPAWSGSEQATQIVERITYHGIAGLITERAQRVSDWPAAVLGPVRDLAVAMAMWELRHKAVLGALLAALAGAKVYGLLLKGTSLAYDLYREPATRSRGDSDLLVASADLAAARTVFALLGYRRQQLREGIADDLALQEIWSLCCDAGTVHHIDLHWQLINAPALGGLLDLAACMADQLPLPRLSPDARSMNRPLTLLHTCVHRAMHLTNPYFVGGVTYYSGDRLIWAKDIDLLTGALSDEEWQCFSTVAIDQKVAAVCFDGLELARRTLGSEIPQEVLHLLGTTGKESASTYLLGSGQARRTWQDLLAICGWRRRLAYVGARSLPKAGFMRNKYPELAGRPLALLQMRRVIDLLRPRPSRTKHR